MSHIAVYVRVSSKSQDQRSQKADLDRWVEAFADGTVRWYRDTRSGTSMDRPGWAKLDAEIEAGNVSTVVVWRLDRLGRTASGLTALFERLQKHKVNLVSLKDGLDLSTPAGRLMANVLASVAAYETEVRRERQQAGIEAARAAGKRWGGSKKGRLVSVTAEQKAAVKRLRGEGEKVSRIARTVGLSRPTIYRLLETNA